MPKECFCRFCFLLYFVAWLGSTILVVCSPDVTQREQSWASTQSPQDDRDVSRGLVHCLLLSPLREAACRPGPAAPPLDSGDHRGVVVLDVVLARIAPQSKRTKCGQGALWGPGPGSSQLAGAPPLPRGLTALQPCWLLLPQKGCLPLGAWFSPPALSDKGVPLGRVSVAPFLRTASLSGRDLWATSGAGWGVCLWSELASGAVRRGELGWRRWGPVFWPGHPWGVSSWGALWKDGLAHLSAADSGP